MTRDEAEQVLYDIIGSGIISEELEESLSQIADAIVYDEFDAGSRRSRTPDESADYLSDGDTGEYGGEY